MNQPLEVIFDVAPAPEQAKRRRRSIVPEQFDANWKRVLITIDAVAALCLALLVLPADFRVAALAFAGIVLALFALSGLYARSFAVTPRDECYSVAAAFIILLFPAWALLAAFGVPSSNAIAAILLGGAGLATLRTLLAYARRGAQRTSFAGVSFIGGDAAQRADSQAFIAAQRAFDLVLAIAALTVFAIPMLVIAAIVRFDSGSPVIFRQERVGRNNTRFNILKFRTMRSDAGDEWARPGDRRITRIGAFLRRTSLDELPQVFNVLRGDMSIVGPRPEMVSFAETFEGSIPHYAERHFVKPGITGWAQVYLKRNLDPSEMPEVAAYDLFYVQHAGIFLNIIIVLKTATEVLFHRAV